MEKQSDDDDWTVLRPLKGVPPPVLKASVVLGLCGAIVGWFFLQPFLSSLMWWFDESFPLNNPITAVLYAEFGSVVLGVAVGGIMPILLYKLIRKAGANGS